jgi:hypothetical protein
MLDSSIFNDIKQIKGYLGSGISEYTGEVLLFDKNRGDVKVEEGAVIFNDVFRDVHSLSKQLVLGQTEIMEITTSNSKVLMACSGENSTIHLHIFAVFQRDGSVALAKMILPKILKKAVSELA